MNFGSMALWGNHFDNQVEVVKFPLNIKRHDFLKFGDSMDSLKLALIPKRQGAPCRQGLCLLHRYVPGTQGCAPEVLRKKAPY